jgi:hypothetical protein
MAPHKITIKAEIHRDLQALIDRVSQIDFDATPQARELFLKFVGDPSNLICVDSDCGPALGTGDVLIVCKPSQAFLDFMAAVAG